MAQKKAGWRGPSYPGEFPTLGYLNAEWIQAHCVIPDRAVAGEPYVLSAEQATHLLWQFRLRPTAVFHIDRPAAPFVYNGSLIVRSQKWGKGPFSGSRICNQAAGPVLFDGWAEGGEYWDCAEHGCGCGWGYEYDVGEPMGKMWATPHIQVAATAEDQTKNIWRALKPMIELGPLADVIPDTGLDRINLPGGGQIEPVTSRALTRLGARLTYIEFDQPESALPTNGGTLLFDTLLRNVAGMGGRWAATGNAHDPSENSAQQTLIDAPLDDVYIDYPEPLTGSWTNKRERRRILKHAYKGSPWVDVDRIEADCDRLEKKGEASQAERFFGNRVVAGAAKAWDLAKYKPLGKPGKEIPAGRVVTLGFDGALHFDSTGLIATDVETGHQETVGIWERPLRLRDEDYWEVPKTEVDEALAYCFDQWDVWRGYFDPPHWRTEIEAWAGQYGTEKIVKWETVRIKPMVFALKAFTQDMRANVMSHDANPKLLKHVGNAVRRPTKVRDPENPSAFLWTIGKDGQKSKNRIDLAMCAVLSWECRSDALRAGVINQPEYERARW